MLQKHKSTKQSISQVQHHSTPGPAQARDHGQAPEDSETDMQKLDHCPNCRERPQETINSRHNRNTTLDKSSQNKLGIPMSILKGATRAKGRQPKEQARHHAPRRMGP